jgi:DNA topoisomerase-3
LVQKRPTGNRFIKNYDFDYPQTNAQFTMTSVSGHLTRHDFEEAYSGWLSCDPFTLFDAPMRVHVHDGSEEIEKNLSKEAKRSDMLMIWTDCDREGEHIGMEVARVCCRAKRNIEVKRARFSAIIAQYVPFELASCRKEFDYLFQANSQCSPASWSARSSTSGCRGSQDRP